MLEGIDNPREIERHLREALHNVALAGELPLTEVDRRKLEDSLRSMPPDEAGRHRPCTLACFLVLVGVHGCREGNFWGAVGSSLGIRLDPLLQQQWGQAFEGVVSGYHLASFSGTGGHRYVAPILGHGGIPDYCLSDFFGKLLLPAVTGRLEYEGDVELLLDEWRARPSLFEFTDRPVRRFLLHGGKTARDFLERCLQMGEEAIIDRTVRGALELGVPDRVVERFRGWFEDRARVIPSRRNQKQFRSAELRFEPDASGLLLVVPAQRIASAVLQGQQPTLEITQDRELLESLQPRVLRRGEVTETQLVELLLRKQFTTLRVCLKAGQSRLRSWEFDGIGPQHPWMAFGDRSGRVIRARPLPATSFWLEWHEISTIECISIVLATPYVVYSPCRWGALFARRAA